MLDDISLENMGKASVYSYLAEQIRMKIQDGSVKPDEKLPSKRAFANKLGINVMTVDKAYNLLIEEGYIYKIERKGFFASDTSDGKNSEKSGIVYDFVSNGISHESFPLSIWSQIMRDVIKKTDSEHLLGTPPADGTDDLRRAIADYLVISRGLHVKPEQIIIGAGAEYLCSRLVKFFGRDKLYALEDPGYRKLSRLYESEGAETVYIPLDGEGMQMKPLYESGADIVHISPAHQYPSGIVTSLARRYSLLSWAAEKDGRYIIEDDYDCEFRFDGNPVPALKGMDASDKVIYMNTFAKTLAPAFRMSYIVMPESLIEKFYESSGFLSCTVSTFEQYTLAKFMRDGYFEEHIIKMREIYRGIRDRIIETLLSSEFADKIKILHQDEGLHFIIEVAEGFDDDKFMRIAEKSGLRIACISKFCHENDINSRKILVSYSGLELGHVASAATVLADCIDKSLSQ